MANVVRRVKGKIFVTTGRDEPCYCVDMALQSWAEDEILLDVFRVEQRNFVEFMFGNITYCQLSARRLDDVSVDIERLNRDIAENLERYLKR